MLPEKSGRKRPERGSSPDAREAGWFVPMALGILGSMAAVVVLFVAVAVYDYLVSPQGRVIDAAASAASYVAVGIGGFVTGRKSRKRGLLFGAVVGLVFAGSILIAGAGGSTSVSVTRAALTRLVLSALAGGVGGMFGVATS